MWSKALRWLSDPAVVATGAAFSLVVIVLSALLVPIVIARLPHDYFVRKHVDVRSRHHPVLRVALDIVRTLLGTLLVLIGLALLVLPGQGVLTIVAGLALLPFPGKRALQRRLLNAPGIHSVVVTIRRRAQRPPLELDRLRDSRGSWHDDA